MGNRFAGGIAPGAMPPLHRYLGNPVLSFIGRLFFRSKIGDFHCGLRGFRRDSVLALELQAAGMEFASEMVVKAALAGQHVTEVPTTLAKDGRSRPPHLHTWRDGWRHLRFLLLFSPRWLFFLPGLALLIAGLVIGAIVIPHPFRVGNGHLRRGHPGRRLGDGGDRLPVRAVLAVHPGLRRLGGVPARRAQGPRLLEKLSLERGLLLGAAIGLAGLAGPIFSLLYWNGQKFSHLNYEHSLRLMIPAVTALMVSFQIILGTFFLSILGIKHTRHPVSTPPPSVPADAVNHVEQPAAAPRL